jgi:GST-like protein
MITLYTAGTPNGRKISIALLELELAADIRPIDLGKGEQNTPAFGKLNPNNKIPLIVDQDNGQVVFESGAILIYLAEKTGRLLSTEPAKRMPTLQWLFMQVGSVGPMLGQLWWFRHGTKEHNGQALDRYGREVERIYGVFDRRLADVSYVAGDDYSIADIANFTWLRTHDELGIDIEAYPHVKAWLDRIGRRPAVQRGLHIPESVDG